VQSEIFQLYCYNFDDYGLQLMKTPNSKLEYCEKVHTCKPKSSKL